MGGALIIALRPGGRGCGADRPSFAVQPVHHLQFSPMLHCPAHIGPESVRPALMLSPHNSHLAAAWSRRGTLSGPPAGCCGVPPAVCVRTTRKDHGAPPYLKRFFLSKSIINQHHYFKSDPHTYCHTYIQVMLTLYDFAEFIYNWDQLSRHGSNLRPPLATPPPQGHRLPVPPHRGEARPDGPHGTHHTRHRRLQPGWRARDCMPPGPGLRQHMHIGQAAGAW
jgi:hypothetical protein